jgi:hypothetical protein
MSDDCPILEGAGPIDVASKHTACSRRAGKANRQEAAGPSPIAATKRASADWPSAELAYYLGFRLRGAKGFPFCLAAFFFALRRMLMSSSIRSSTGLRFFALRRIQTNESRRLSRARPFIFFSLLILRSSLSITPECYVNSASSGLLYYDVIVTSTRSPHPPLARRLHISKQAMPGFALAIMKASVREISAGCRSCECGQNFGKSKQAIESRDISMTRNRLCTGLSPGLGDREKTGGMCGRMIERFFKRLTLDPQMRTATVRN